MIDEFPSSIPDCHFSIGVSTSHRAGGFAKHYHSWFEIYQLMDGECHFFVDDAIYNLIAGDIVLIPPCHTHKVSYYNSRYSRSVLNIAPSYIPSLAGELVKQKGFVYRIPEVADKISDIYKIIEQEYCHWDRFSNDIANGNIQVFLALLLRNKNLYVNEHPCTNTYINDIIKYIQHNYSSNITLTQTAKVHFISPEHLARTFKQETGMTFHNYLTNIRFKEAERLLKKKHSKSISEIAFACGFNDSNYFSTKFKCIYGISPLQFCNQHRSSKDK